MSKVYCRFSRLVNLQGCCGAGVVDSMALEYLAYTDFNALPLFQNIVSDLPKVATEQDQVGHVRLHN